MGRLSDDFAFPPSRGTGEHRATGFLAGRETLSANGVALTLVALEEVESSVKLVLADDVDGKDAGIGDVPIAARVGLDAHSHKRRIK